MIIDIHPDKRRLIARTQTPRELEDLRDLPIRKWDAKASVWILPATPSNKRALAPYFDCATPAARRLLESTGPAKRAIPSNYVFKTPPFAHQKEMVERALAQDAFGFFTEPGCVDADTEYLSPQGWRRIADYCEGGEVAQIAEYGLEFVIPEAYINAEYLGPWFHMHHARGLDMMLTPGHWMVVNLEDGSPLRIQAEDWVRCLDTHASIPCLFSSKLPDIDISDEHIRLMIAVMADSNFPRRAGGTTSDRCRMRLKKPRKIERIQLLLKNAGIPYIIQECAPYDGFHELYFTPPYKWKQYPREWWRMSDRQLRIVMDEFPHWDGSAAVGPRGAQFSSNHQGDVDFIQYVAHATGSRASVLCNRGNWQVSVRGTPTLMGMLPRNVERIPEGPSRCYCFTVPSHTLLLRRNGKIFITGNTGKSKALIDTATVEYGVGEIHGSAVICPNSIKTNWQDEIALHCPMPVDVFVYSPDVKKQAAKWISEPHKAMPWFIIAVESLSSGDGAQFLEAYLKMGGISLNLDESSRIKNHQASRTKKLLALGKLAKKRRIATGTPITRGIQDAWSQFEFLDPNILSLGFYPFRNRYCVMGGFQAKQIVGSRNEPEFVETTSPHVITIRKEDCLDLPEKIYQVRKVTPTEAQVRLYRQLRDSGMAETENGFASYNNALVRELRLQQICGGFIATEKDLAHVLGHQSDFMMLSPDEWEAVVCEKVPMALEPIAGGNPKIQELVDIVDEIPGKLIVWCRFRAEIASISKALSPYGKVVEFHGGVPLEERSEARRAFQTDPDVRFFVAQISTGGIGITLTAASVEVYFSNSFSLEERIQSEDRVHRIGQTETCVYIDLVMDDGKKPWTDSKVLKALREKRNYADVVVEELRKNSGLRE